MLESIFPWAPLLKTVDKVIHWLAVQWITLFSMLNNQALSCIYFGSMPDMGNDQKSLSRAVAKSLANEIKVKSPYL